MRLFKRGQKCEIPPVESAPPPPYSSVQPSNTQYTSKRLDLSVPDSRGNEVHAELSLKITNKYAPAEHGMDAERKALFGTATAVATDRPYHNQFLAGSASHSNGEAEVEGDEQAVETIKTKIKEEKNSTLETTNRIRRIAEEAQTVATGTLEKLGGQSESLANAERHLDMAKGNTDRAKDQTDELKQLNRSIFRPVITFNKEKKRRAQEEKLQGRYEEEREDHEQTMRDIRETQTRLNPWDDDDAISTNKNGKAREANRKRYQFESTESDDDVEDNIDSNLDVIANSVKNLNRVASAMGQEIDAQNNRLDRMNLKTDSLNVKVQRGTTALRKIK